MPPRTTRSLRPALAGALLVAGTVAACRRSAPPVSGPEPADDSCVVGSGEDGGGDLVVALDEPADSTLLAGSRVPPIRFDCRGRPRPGLASAWHADSTGRSWTLTVSDAGDLARTWRADQAVATLRWAGVQALVPLDAQRLAVTFGEPHTAVPRAFADPTLGLERSGASIGLRHMGPVADPRDAVDRGADVVRTSDPIALDYASARPGLTVVPLPWDRTYVLVLSPGVGGVDPIGSRDTAAFRAALASDVVSGDARPADAGWSDTVARCRGAAPAPAAGIAPAPRALLYPRRDPVARALAERLVAMSRGADLVARAAEPAALSASLRRAGASGYVVALPAAPLVPCREIADWPAGATAVSLVDTRAHLILREGAPPVEFDFRGALRRAGRR